MQKQQLQHSVRLVKFKDFETEFSNNKIWMYRPELILPTGHIATHCGFETNRNNAYSDLRLAMSKAKDWSEQYNTQIKFYCKTKNGEMKPLRKIH